ncbi:MAG: lipid A biosynthesis lauroyl acyltransferase [Cellvibrionaceae bacterium]|nr:lipid A biosynthesis lauroyl acyltransferase [Cellvibrionaceae bacterium]
MSRQHQNLDRFQAQFLLPKYWLLWLWFAILWLVGQLPLAAIRALGRGTGALAYKFANSRRRVTLRNLELCFPEKSAAEREAIARDCFAGAGMALWESGLVWFGRKSRVQRLTQISGLEHLQGREGKPTLILAMHNTCLEMAYGPLALQHSVKILFRVHNNPFWEYMAQKGRGRFNLELISNKRVSQFLDHLRSGHSGLIAADHDLGRKNSVFAPFFGIPTATVTTPSSFASSTGAEVFFAYGYRTRQGYQLQVAPVPEMPSDDIEADICHFNQLIESAARLHPADYMWMHRRFKTRPDGAEDLYKK